MKKEELDKLFTGYLSRQTREADLHQPDLSQQIMAALPSKSDSKHSYFRPWSLGIVRTIGTIAGLAIAPFIIFPPKDFSNYSALEDWHKSIAELKLAWLELFQYITTDQNSLGCAFALILSLVILKSVRNSNSKVAKIAIILAIFQGIAALGAFLIDI